MATAAADTQRPTRSPQRRVTLDLVRFLGCMAIAIWHYQHFSFIGDALPDFHVEDQPFYRWFWLFYEQGGKFRVQVFWSISGFVMFLTYAQRIASHAVGPRKFFFDRVARLYPLYLLSFVIVALLQALFWHLNGIYFVYQDNDLLHALLGLVMASAWLPNMGLGFNGPIWSLSVLIPVYALFFTLVWRRGPSIRVNLALIVLCALAYAVLSNTQILECAAHFFAGGIGALVYIRYAEGPWGPWLKRLAVMALGALVVVAMLWGETLLLPLLPSILYVIVPTLCFAAASVRNLPTPVAALFHKLGDLSYGVFLLHFPLQLVIVMIANAQDVSLPVLSPWFFLAYLGATLVLAQIGLVLCERPAQRALRRVFGTAPARIMP